MNRINIRLIYPGQRIEDYQFESHELAIAFSQGVVEGFSGGSIISTKEMLEVPQHEVPTTKEDSTDRTRKKGAR